MKYIMNASTGELEEIAKIGQEKILKTATAARTDSLNNKPDTKVVPKLVDSEILKNNIDNKKIAVPDYINRVQALYGEAPLNESNKRKDAAIAAANKKNNVDPNRPAFSDSDVVFAAMNHQDAMRFTGGHDREKIKFLRQIKSRLHRQEAYDEAKNKQKL